MKKNKLGRRLRGTPEYVQICFLDFWRPEKCIFSNMIDLVFQHSKNTPCKRAFRNIETSKMKLYVKIGNEWKPLIIFAKSFILDVRLGFVYASLLTYAYS